jgi:hypothetical protein
MARGEAVEAGQGSSKGGHLPVWAMLEMPPGEAAAEASLPPDAVLTCIT